MYLPQSEAMIDPTRVEPVKLQARSQSVRAEEGKNGFSLLDFANFSMSDESLSDLWCILRRDVDDCEDTVG